MNTIAGIVVGSGSDQKVMKDATAVLDEFGIAYEVDVVSTRRVPEDAVEYGRKASERGLRAIITGAEGATRLPGMLVALTPLSVIGVPISLRHLGGMDSLLSIVQMPASVSVATVSIAGMRNVGLLTTCIIGDVPTDRDVRDRVAAFQDGLRETAKTKEVTLRGKLGG